MYVQKRNGITEEVKFDKIILRLKKLCHDLNEKYVDPIKIAQKVVSGVYKGVTTSQLDELAAETAAYMSIDHPDFSKLAARITVSNLHKETLKNFSDVSEILYNYIHPRTKKHAPLIAEDVYQIINKYSDRLDNAIDYKRDFTYDYFGLKTLMRSYLLKVDGKIAERPQHMLMRVAIGIHKNDIERAIETYELMSDKFFTHATPTLYNAGTTRPQLSSCFLLTMKDDSIEGIYDTLKQCALISKNAGGIGLSAHTIRASNSYIRGTNGISNGLVPMLQVYNNTARYVDQGGGRRKGSFAIYLEPWHPDIFEFLDLRKNHGKEEARARDLFYALWTPDLFMQRVQANGDWSLFCPDEAPGLCDVYGDKFKELYERYEKEGRARKVVKAQVLWWKILESQIETGTPYMLFKDACNEKSNQKNLGTIRNSNLCCEILQYSSKDEVAVCNLASIGLNKFVEQKKVNYTKARIYTKTDCSYCKRAKALLNDFNIETEVINLDDDVKRKEFYHNMTNEHKKEIHSVPQIYLGDSDEESGIDFEEYIGGWEDLNKILCLEFNFKKLYEITRVITRNLNRVIDVNFYPVEEARNSNMKHRPIGIGVQGLADVFQMFKYPFESAEAKKLNIEIFETIYYAAVSMSIDLAKEEGHYESYPGSPASKGILQPDMWGVTPSDRWDWGKLKSDLLQNGMRNSLLVAPMPTASTSQILGNNECIEPYTSNLYTRRTLAGEFAVVNKHLLKDLLDRELWNYKLKQELMMNNGSIQNIDGIPKDMKELYKTVWEIKQKNILEMSADRGPYIDQTQSLNIHMESPKSNQLTSMHFFAWRKGLKTGMYYLRTKAAVDAIKFTVDQGAIKKENENNDVGDECEACGS